MRVLIVCSYKQHLAGHLAPFVREQVEALALNGVVTDCFLVHGKGIKGYLRTLPALKRKIKEFAPDIVHAHFGLCGLLANLQRKVPVVTTYHGSDINVKSNLRLSRLAMRLSACNIFVSQRNLDIAKPKNNYVLLPCGVNLSDYEPRDKSLVRQRLGWNADAKKVLFAGSFDNAVKNASLAKEAVALLDNVELVELKGYSREQVADLMYASDAFLMTSLTEGSPQVIKEALACGCPIVSVDVGDVAERITSVEGCYIAERTAVAIAAKLQLALCVDRTNGRDSISELDNRTIATKLMETVYKRLLNLHD